MCGCEASGCEVSIKILKHYQPLTLDSQKRYHLSYLSTIKFNQL